MRLLVYGSRDFAATAADLARHCGHEIAGMVDDYNTGPDILGSLEIVSHTHPPSDFGMIMAIGYSNILGRWTAWMKVKALGYSAPALIHPRAYVAESACIGEGVMVMAGAIADVRADVGDLAVLWPGSCINHDVRVGLNTFVSPNATVCGFVEIGAHSFIGAGAAIADRVKVPEASFIKMLERFSGKPE
jgi:sugar O-acyltransferase (sialic acid O-acetyltransferase NeuD family)